MAAALQRPARPFRPGQRSLEGNPSHCKVCAIEITEVSNNRNRPGTTFLHQLTAPLESLISATQWATGKSYSSPGEDTGRGLCMPARPSSFFANRQWLPGVLLAGPPFVRLLPPIAFTCETQGEHLLFNSLRLMYRATATRFLRQLTVCQDGPQVIGVHRVMPECPRRLYIHQCRVQQALALQLSTESTACETHLTCRYDQNSA